MPVPYATVAEADVLNSTDNQWIAATTAQKESALKFARRYMDINYSCVTIDMTAIPDDIKLANSILAASHLREPLYNKAPSIENLKSKSTSASGVTVSRTYGAKTTKIDPFVEVTMLLSDYCALKIGTISSARLKGMQ